MKTCLKCNESKSEDEFGWRNKAKQWLKPYCIPCNRIYDLRRYDATKEDRVRLKKINNKLYLEKTNELIAQYLLKNPCVDCGKSDIRFLDFDHIGTKNHNISDMVRVHYSWNRIQKGIKLCEVRCLECHRIKTLQGVDAWRLKMYNKYQR